MTAIRGIVPPTRRPGELGIHSLDRFHFAVPDLSAAKSFYDEFGLETGEHRGEVTLKTRGHAHLWGTIGEGPRKKHGFLSFGAFEDDLERFAERLGTMGIRRLDPPPGVEFERAVVQRPRRQPDRDQGGREVVAEREIRFRLHRDRAECARRARPLRRAADLPAPSLARPPLHPRRDEGDRLLYARPRHAPLRPFRRGHRLSARHPWQRPSYGRLRPFGRARLPSSLLGRRQRRRDRHGRDAHAGPWLRPGLGTGAPRARLELFPLCPRPVGKLRRIFRRHRLRPGRLRLEERRPSARGTRSTSGAQIHRRISPTITRREGSARLRAPRARPVPADLRQIDCGPASPLQRSPFA